MEKSYEQQQKKRHNNSYVNNKAFNLGLVMSPMYV